MTTPHKRRTAAHLADFRSAYSLSLSRGLLPLIFFAPSIELARQSLLRYLAEHVRWQHSLTAMLGAGSALPFTVRCVLVCSDDEPLANTGDVLCKSAGDMSHLLADAAAHPGEKVRSKLMAQRCPACCSHSLSMVC